jgi:hypothetical protein
MDELVFVELHFSEQYSRASFLGRKIFERILPGCHHGWS